MKSAVLIIPAALLPAAEAVATAMGWGSPSYTIPLSDGSAEGATHWGCRTRVSPVFEGLLADPPPLPGLPEVLAALIVDISAVQDGRPHLEQVAAAHGLELI